MVKATPVSENVRRQLRQAFGSFTTGVTVVTARDHEGRPIGFTANSFTSVSLDPPLLLVCLAKTSSNLEHFTRASRFAVNILSEAQEDISNRFASRVEDRFAEIAWHEGRDCTPLIDGVVAWFDCRTDNLVDAGDHIILIGFITDFDHSEQRPLAYLRGHYLGLGLAEEAVDSVSHHGGVRVGCLLDYRGQVLLHRDPNGWSLPLGAVCPGFREGRGALQEVLKRQGVVAELGFLYSVFDGPAGNATWLIFLGEIERHKAAAGFEFFAVGDLPLQEVEPRQIRSVLARYRAEFRKARFGLYVDDAENGGQISPIERSAKSWTKFITEQESPS